MNTTKEKYMAISVPEIRHKFKVTVTTQNDFVHSLTVYSFSNLGALMLAAVKFGELRFEITDPDIISVVKQPEEI